MLTRCQPSSNIIQTRFRPGFESTQSNKGKRMKQTHNHSWCRTGCGRFTGKELLVGISDSITAEEECQNIMNCIRKAFWKFLTLTVNLKSQGTESHILRTSVTPFQDIYDGSRVVSGLSREVGENLVIKIWPSKGPWFSLGSQGALVSLLGGGKAFKGQGFPVKQRNFPYHIPILRYLLIFYLQA